MKTVKVSVVMPVFNTVNFVEEAVTSILRQTLQEIEVILINDGSTDGSRDILSRLAGTDSRIQLYDQINSGQAVARNVGISMASGKYIYFMDSDDILLPSALEECYCLCEDQSLDFVFFDADTFGSEGHFDLGYDYKRCHNLRPGIYSGAEIMQQLLDHRAFRVAPWLQLIRKSYLERIGLRFVSITHEDELFTHLLFLQAERVSFISQVFFRRRLRSNSVVTTPFKLINAEAYFYIVRVLLEKQLDVGVRSMQHHLIHRSVKAILNGMLYKARALPYRDRLLVCKQLIKNGYWFVSPKSIVTLLIL